MVEVLGRQSIHLHSTFSPSIISWTDNTELDLIKDQCLEKLKDMVEELDIQGIPLYLHSLNHLLDW